MSVIKTQLSQFKIHCQAVYIVGESKPEEDYYFFAYKISIENKGSSTAQLMSRHWQILDGNGKVEEVRGPGVVGLQPKIQSGQTFEYESACPLPTSWGSMKGHYHFISENGESFTVDIPEFFLVAPQALH